MASSTNIKILQAMKLGTQISMTNLIHHLPTNLSVVYWHKENDLTKRVLNNDLRGWRYHTGDYLECILDKFDILQRPDDEKEYEITFGELMSVEKLWMQWPGYAVHHGDPFKIFKGEELINAAVLLVYYKHKHDPKMSFRAFYGLYTALHKSSSVCFGQI